ncbi:Acetyltransferase (GNAT) domain-containing protein [Sphingomonas palmae]|uniref:Acetyltransferase (GNAT) domain-containing protein n=1 Tax=Sphingomonas palmae TaxID=1855283 RepID=A0A1H7U3U7_9SPHN|nr:GNAT family N-acetyltransferase [Sphingomonas palmae]SEL91484.1 Acetyltransferase (GNAT) domain-containing protein [Sphingomonas palmae]
MLAVSSREPFHFGSDWFNCWAAAFGEIEEIDGVRLVAAQRRLEPFRLAIRRSATNPHSVHFGVPDSAPLRHDLPRRLLAGVAAVELEYLPHGSRLIEAAEEWRGRFRVRIAPHALAPLIDTSGNHEAWLGARSKRIRQMLRRESDATARLGMRFAHVTADPTSSDLWRQMLALEQSGWKGRERSAILDDPQASRFYTDLVRSAAAAGALQIGLMWLGERLVAFEFGVLGGERLFLLKVAYDEEFADLSLGHVLAARMIRHCFETPTITCYDKMGNGMTPAPYKLRFADRCDPLYRVTLYSDSPAGTLLYAYDAARSHAKAWRDKRRRTA